MKKSILGLRTTAYKVPDLNAAAEWYSKAFETTPYFNEAFYVGFSVGGFELGLLPEGDLSTQADNILSYWGVEDIQGRYDHFIACGATEHEKPNNVGGDLMVASVRDPWGNVIGLIYNPDFKIETE